MSVMKAPTAPPVVSETAAILSVIERAASNPDVDLDKLERLLEMRERVEAQQALKAFAAAFPDLQSSIPEIDEKGSIDLGRGKPIPYAKWEDINRVIKPILADHGFGLSFRTNNIDNKVTVTAILRHVMGHSEETSLTLHADTSGNKNPVHGIGSSTSYGMRYTARALLNINSRLDIDRDDCGMAGGGSAKRDDEPSQPECLPEEESQKIYSAFAQTLIMAESIDEIDKWMSDNLKVIETLHPKHKALLRKSVKDLRAELKKVAA